MPEVTAARHLVPGPQLARGCQCDQGYCWTQPTLYIYLRGAGQRMRPENGLLAPLRPHWPACWLRPGQLCARAKGQGPIPELQRRQRRAHHRLRLQPRTGGGLCFLGQRQGTYPAYYLALPPGPLWSLPRRRPRDELFNFMDYLADSINLRRRGDFLLNAPLIGKADIPYLPASSPSAYPPGSGNR